MDGCSNDVRDRVEDTEGLLCLWRCFWFLSCAKNCHCCPPTSLIALLWVSSWHQRSVDQQMNGCSNDVRDRVEDTEGLLCLWRCFWFLSCAKNCHCCPPTSLIALLWVSSWQQRSVDQQMDGCANDVRDRVEDSEGLLCLWCCFWFLSCAKNCHCCPSSSLIALFWVSSWHQRSVDQQMHGCANDVRDHVEDAEGLLCLWRCFWSLSCAKNCHCCPPTSLISLLWVSSWHQRFVDQQMDGCANDVRDRVQALQRPGACAYASLVDRTPGCLHCGAGARNCAYSEWGSVLNDFTECQMTGGNRRLENLPRVTLLAPGSPAAVPGDAY